MSRAVFISYRRNDSEGEAGRLFDDLVRSFDEKSVFMDVTDIAPGLDFRKVIDDNVSTCGVLLAMIGPTWATITDSSGERRLDNPNDFVRLEIASALARDIAVIPVLVHGAQMPHPDQLPDNLKDLAFRNSVEITHTRWNSDVQLLINALGQYVGAPNSPSDEPVHATVAVQLPPANPPVHEPTPRPPSRLPLFAGIALGAALVIAAVSFYAVSHRHSGKNHADVPESQLQNGAATVPAAATPNSLVGTWTNPTPVADNGLNKLDISATGDQLSIHAWGKCQPVDCDWGVQSATVNGQSASATWILRQQSAKKELNRVATVTLTPQGIALDVSIVNTFGGKAGSERQFQFVRPQ